MKNKENTAKYIGFKTKYTTMKIKIDNKISFIFLLIFCSINKSKYNLQPKIVPLELIFYIFPFLISSLTKALKVE